MHLETNIPLFVWAELPALQRWARESLQAFEAKVPFQQQRHFALDFQFTKINGLSTKAKIIAICVSLDFLHRNTAVFSVPSRSLPVIEEWLANLPINPAAPAATLEDLLYGRNRNPSAQNNSGPPHGAGGGPGGAKQSFTHQSYHAALAQQKAAGLARASGIASQLTIKQLNTMQNAMTNRALLYGNFDCTSGSYLEAPKLFPKTQRGETSLSEALSGALPEAEELERAAHNHRAMRNKYLALTGKAPADILWGTPPENPQLHIQQGEILATRIWFTDGTRLSSIHQNCWWALGSTMDGDVTKAGVFAFKRELLAIPLLYCYIRDARNLMREGRNAGAMIPLEFMHLRSARAIVLGTVKLWGEVVEHQYGYRAQFARIASLQECSEPEMLPAIRAHYGVPND